MNSPFGQVFVRVEDDQNKVIAMLQEINPQATLEASILLAVGVAICKMRELFDAMENRAPDEDDGESPNEVPLGFITLYYHHQRSSIEGDDIELRPSPFVLEHVEQICESFNKLIDKMMLQVTPMVGETFITLTMRAIDICDNDDEPLGDVD